MGDHLVPPSRLFRHLECDHLVSPSWRRRLEDAHDRARFGLNGQSVRAIIIRMAVDDIKRSGRSTQGVIVMRLREGEHVSSLAPVVEAAEDKSDATNTAEAVPQA